jgi:RNA polymerase sigma factor (sigma-70 family)
MADTPLARAVRGLRHLVGGGGAPDKSDGHLLRQFAARRDEAAFEALVRRHGPMVLGVCRRVLGDAHDAEDAFQATFLVLARKAAGVVRCRAVGGWLHEVAYHVALRQRAHTARRRRHERQVGRVTPQQVLTDLDRRELRQVLDEELRRLPQKYGTPLVLCYLEGRSQEEAARALACPVSTLGWRLGRGRELLRVRLLRRGLALPAAAVEAALADQASAALPAALAGVVVEGAAAFTRGSAAAPGASRGAAVLAQGVLKSMALTKLRFAAALALTVALGLGAGLWALAVPAADPPSRDKAGAPTAGAPSAVAPKAVSRAAPFQERRTFKAARRSDRDRVVQFLAFSPDGKWLVEGDSREAGLYDGATGKELAALKGSVAKANPVNLETGAEGKVLALTAHFMFGAAGKELAAIDESGVTLWDLETKKVLAELDIGGDRGGDQPVRFESHAVTFSADGKRAAAGDENGTVKVWDLTGLWRKRPLAKAELLTLTAAVRARAPAPDEKEPDGILHPAAVHALAFSPDGKMLAAVQNKGRVRAWETATGKKRMAAGGDRPATNMIPWAKALVFAPDGKRLAVADRAGLRLFAVPTGKELTAFDFGGGPEPLPASVPVGAERPAGAPLGPARVARPYVTTMAFSPGGKAVVVGFSDGAIHVWDLAGLWAEAPAAPSAPLAKLRHGPNVASGDVAQVAAIAISADGRSFATASADGLIKVWDAVRRK